LANARAVALPMPEVPPVIRTVLFWKIFISWPQRNECRFFGKVNGALSFVTLGPPKGKHVPGRYEEPSLSESLWRTVE
jgi:hypothetical protein